MSNSESLPADGDQPTPTVTPSEPEDPPATPDPLLGSGSFIAPSNGGTQSASNEHQSASKESTNPDDDLLQKYPRPSWLPEDFKMTLKKRTSGATEGTVDRYYIAPTGQRLRSKNEVLTFLATGTKRKKPSTSTPTPTQTSDDASAKGPTPQTKKKTSARKKVHAAFTFDFKNPPEKVSWCLNYATDDVWSPSIGDWNIPLATKQEWAAVFNHVCQS